MNSTIIQIDIVFSKCDVFSLLSGCKNYTNDPAAYFHCKLNGKRRESPFALPPTPDPTA